MTAQIRLLKEQGLDAKCDGVVDLAFSATQIQVKPGECVIYRVQASNQGVDAVTNVIMNDSVPAFSTYVDIRTRPSAPRVRPPRRPMAAPARSPATWVNSSWQGHDAVQRQAGRPSLPFAWAQALASGRGGSRRSASSFQNPDSERLIRMPVDWRNFLSFPRSAHPARRDQPGRARSGPARARLSRADAGRAPAAGMGIHLQRPRQRPNLDRGFAAGRHHPAHAGRCHVAARRARESAFSNIVEVRSRRWKRCCSRLAARATASPAPACRCRTC